MEEVSRVVIVGVVSGTMFLLLFTLVMMMVLINYQRRKKKLLYEKKAMEAHFQQELLQAKLEVQEHIFKTVSQELHDNVGQILSLAKVNLNILTMEGPHDARIKEVSGLVGNAIHELRDISSGFFADKLLEEGLVTAIRKELIKLEKTGLLMTSFYTDTEHLLIDKTKTIFLYRIVQEICNNIIKHSAAANVSVAIHNRQQQIQISIHDDGKGFNESDDRFKPGIGLSSIRQRAEMIGAYITIDSSTGKGTSIQLTIKEGSI